MSGSIPNKVTVVSLLITLGPVYCWLWSGHDPLHLCCFFWFRPSPEQQGFLLCHLHDGESGVNHLPKCPLTVITVTITAVALCFYFDIKTVFL